MIQLNQRVRDTVTGFTGLVLGRAEYVYESTSCRVHQQTLDTYGKMPDGVWIDEARLEVIQADNKPVGFSAINVTGTTQPSKEN
jgi:hypothetical protein